MWKIPKFSLKTIEKIGKNLTKIEIFHWFLGELSKPSRGWPPPYISSPLDLNPPEKFLRALVRSLFWRVFKWYLTLIFLKRDLTGLITATVLTTIWIVRMFYFVFTCPVILNANNSGKQFLSEHILK